jgi:hypothetical protein
MHGRGCDGWGALQAKSFKVEPRSEFPGLEYRPSGMVERLVSRERRGVPFKGVARGFSPDQQDYNSFQSPSVAASIDRFGSNCAHIFSDLVQ